MSGNLPTGHYFLAPEVSTFWRFDFTTICEVMTAAVAAVDRESLVFSVEG